MRPSRFSAYVRAHDWFAVAVDFFIVVLGVYVAVWVSNQQAARDRKEQTTKVVAAHPDLLWELCFYYDERDGTGPPGPFAAHMDRLQEWRRDIARLHQWAQCLDNRLREPSTSEPSCRPTVGGTIDVGGPKM